MTIPVLIDTSDLERVYDGITKEQVDAVCDNIAKSLAANYASQLEREANSALHQTKKRYINAVQIVDTGRLEGTVVLHLTDPVVRMIEEGATSYDIKLGLFKSSKVKFTKDGRKFITVPFRVGTPGAVADSDVFSRTMPMDVYKVAKDEVANISVSGGGMRSAGLTIDKLPAKYQTPQKRAEIKDSAGKVLFNEYVHKSPLDEGLMKFTDAATGQNRYGSFRRVSESGTSESGAKLGSDPDSWIHKGIERYNLVGRTLSNFNIDNEVSVALNNEFAKLGL